MIDSILDQLTILAEERDDPQDIVRARLRSEAIELYVRINPRLCQGQMLIALVLVDCQIAEAAQHQGLFTALLSKLEARADALGLQAVVAENVINPHLLPFLLRRGYRPVHLTNDTLYKEIPQ
jgi:GNAT superfamily N-acetyltransferase